MNRKITYPNLPQLFLKARESVFCHFRPIINHFGLTEQQWRILRTVNEHRELEPWELCDICQILSSSMAGVLARMEDLELIQRSRVREDQRRVLVRLDLKGKQLVEAIAPLIEAQYRYLEKAFGKKLLREVFLSLDKVIATEKIAVEHVVLPAKTPLQPKPSAPSKRGANDTAPHNQ